MSDRRSLVADVKLFILFHIHSFIYHYSIPSVLDFGITILIWKFIKIGTPLCREARVQKEMFIYVYLRTRKMQSLHRARLSSTCCVSIHFFYYNPMCLMGKGE